MLQSLVTDSVILHQGIYRTLLTALSRPGEICALPRDCGPDGRNIAKSILETFLDHEVSFAVADHPDSRLSAADITGWTHSREVPLSAADFLVVDGPQSYGQVIDLKRGTAELPEQGATVIYFLSKSSTADSLSGDVTISGPGVAPPGKRAFPPFGLASAEFRAIREANLEYPMGIDCFFIGADATVAGLPRSVTISMKDEA